MEIKTFYFNPLRECCYVVWDDMAECVIIDPGCHGDREFERLRLFVEEKQLKPVSVLLTHGHFDHILGLEDTARCWDLDVFLDPDDRMQLDLALNWSRELGLTYKPFTGRLRDLADGDVIRFGHTQLRVITTPGHTQGCVCFYSGTAALYRRHPVRRQHRTDRPSRRRLRPVDREHRPETASARRGCQSPPRTRPVHDNRVRTGHQSLPATLLTWLRTIKSRLSAPASTI